MKEKNTNGWDIVRTFLVLTVVFSIFAMLFAAMIFVFKPLVSQWINMKANAPTVSMADPTVEPTKAPKVEPTEAPKVEPTEAPKADTVEPTEPGELEQYSCSWLRNCSTKVVPDNSFAITFKKVGALDVANCDWAILSAGEDINYSSIDEFITFAEGSIPVGTTLEDFVAQEAKTVWACNAHAETAITVRDTYYEQYSCANLSTCQIKTVPAGTFTVGYTSDGKGDCTTKVWSQGQEILFEGVGEIHTYDVGLPMTSLELFIESQKPFVSSCH